jgi:hypothetical protein
LEGEQIKGAVGGLKHKPDCRRIEDPDCKAIMQACAFTDYHPVMFLSCTIFDGSSWFRV